MITDYHFRGLNYLRSSFTVLVSPLQYAVDYPVRVFDSLHLLLKSQKNLVDENNALKYQQTILLAQLQKFKVIKNENDELKALLFASSKIDNRAMAAQILAVDVTPTRQLVIVNHGKRDGIFIGQPVLDAKGVVGQIIDVGQFTSTVLLITDAKSAIPIQNQRTLERAILVGTNNPGELSLINLPKTSNIVRGDLLMTSGLGRRYPEGYPVGIVREVKNIPGEDFIKVLVTPVAKLNQSRLVLLLWPDEEHLKLTAEINASLKNAQTKG